jgi:hypothetical protein
LGFEKGRREKVKTIFFNCALGAGEASSFFSSFSAPFSSFLPSSRPRFSFIKNPFFPA